mmetsp:Transcript_5208/g.14019  ORF Transcript_5208/g.14019 Transcript_5208/m.14019 type:complete len:208 (+) Transcript_5208:184-807(+)
MFIYSTVPCCGLIRERNAGRRQPFFVGLVLFDCLGLLHSDIAHTTCHHFILLFLQGNDGRDFRNVMHEHVLHALLQRDGGAWASHARSGELDRDQARLLLEVDVADVAAIFLHRRTDPRLHELLDHGHDLVVVIQYGGVGDLRLVQQGRLIGIEEVHEGGEYLRAHHLPFVLREFGDGDEVSAEVDGLDALDAEEIPGERRQVDLAR